MLRLLPLLLLSCSSPSRGVAAAPSPPVRYLPTPRPACLRVPPPEPPDLPPSTVPTEAEIVRYIHQLEGYARTAWAACGSLR